MNETEHQWKEDIRNRYWEEARSRIGVVPSGIFRRMLSA